MKKRWRILPRFGLKAILIATTLVAVICGSWIRQAHVQQDVCERLKQTGIEVNFDEPWAWFNWLPVSVMSLGGGHYFCPVTEINLNVNFSSPLRENPNDNDCLVWVAKLPRLKRLKIDSYLVDARDFPALRATKLDQLDLSYCALKDEDISQLPRLPSLKTLVLVGNDQLTGKYVDLGRFPSLEQFECYSTGLNDAALSEVARLSSLKLLMIGNSQVTDVGVASISSLKDLKSIDITSTRVTGAGIKKLTTLETIDLSHTDLNDEALIEIAKLPNLKDFSFSDCGLVTDKGMKALAHHPMLQNVMASRCNITDASIDSLATLGSLQYLWLEGTQSQSIAKLAACKNLQRLRVSASEVPISDAMLFSKHRKLSIDIQDPVIHDPFKDDVEISSGCFCCFGYVPSSLSSIELSVMAGDSLGGNSSALMFDGLTGLTAKHFANFGCNVTQLSLARSKFQANIFDDLSNWPVLTDLDLSKSSVSNEDLRAIGGLQGLTTLKLDSTAIDDMGMLELSSLTQLNDLSLGATQVTPTSLNVIKRFDQLDSLTLPFVPDAASLIELLEACPRLTSVMCVFANAESGIKLMRYDRFRLSEMELTPEQLARLLELHKQRGMEISNIEGSKLNDRHCEMLAARDDIDTLDVSNSLVTDVGIAHLANMPGLMTLNIAHTAVTPMGLKSLQGLRTLTELECAPQKWSNEFVTEMFEIKSLHEVSLPFSGMPSSEARAFVASAYDFDLSSAYEGGPRIEERIYFTREDLGWMAGKSPFEATSAQLTLVGPLIDEAKIAEVIGSPKIELVYAKNVGCKSDALVAKLMECENTKQVLMRGVRLIPQDISKLGQLKRMESLELTNCGLTNAHFSEIAKLQRLSTLIIEDDIVEVEGLTEITRLARLQKLYLKTKDPAAKYESIQQQLGKRFEIVDRAR